MNVHLKALLIGFPIMCLGTAAIWVAMQFPIVIFAASFVALGSYYCGRAFLSYRDE